MALYAIGDTISRWAVTSPWMCSAAAGAAMWISSGQVLQRSIRRIRVVLCGDLSWGMSLEQARGLCLPGRIARTEDSAEGEPRLLVDHRRQNGTLFCGKRLLYA